MAPSHPLARFLAGMEYPATKDDLLREATRDGLAAADRALLRELPEQNYSAAWHVRFKLSAVAHSDAFTPPLVTT